MNIALSTSRFGSASAQLLAFPAIAAENTEKPKKKSDVFTAFHPQVRKEIQRLDKAFSGAITQELKRLEYRPARGKQTTLLLSGKKGSVQRLLLFGMNADVLLDTEPDLEQWREFGGTIWKRAKSEKLTKVEIALTVLAKAHSKEVVLALGEGLALANYSFNAFKGTRKKSKTPSVNIACHLATKAKPAKSVLASATARAEAISLTRDLVNTPPSDLIPKDLMRAAKTISAKHRSISLRVFDKAALKKLKAEAILGVSRGSASSPYLLHLKYTPEKRSGKLKKIALVGKGVTFDSGGMSMKSAGGMVDMKCDMAGAAAVLGVFSAIASLPKQDRPKHEVHGLIPSVENMVSESSVKPGDVLKAINGKTIEVLNTDAEGRLILADALSYSKRVKPDAIVDVATLTGSVVAALGPEFAGLFCEDKDLCSKLVSASSLAGEPLWLLPLGERQYRSLLDSKVADIKNSAGTHPGASLAALFLKEFVPEDAAWAHLDIAGTAFGSKHRNSYTKAGASGFGVRTLLELLQII